MRPGTWTSSPVSIGGDPHSRLPREVAFIHVSKIREVAFIHVSKTPKACFELLILDRAAGGKEQPCGKASPNPARGLGAKVGCLDACFP